MAVITSYMVTVAELSVSDLARRVRISKSTAYRPPVTGRHNEFTAYGAETDKYHIGSAFYTPGSLYLSASDDT